MREAKLKTKFDSEISTPDKEILWDELQSLGFVNDVLRGDSDWKEFEQEANRMAEAHRKLLRRSKPPGRKPRRYYRVGVELTALEADHARTFTTYVAKRAAALPEIRSFRDKKLDGGTLQPEQVVAFLQSELEALPPEDYMVEGMDVQAAHLHLSRDEEEELKDLVAGWENRRYVPSDEYSYKAFREALEFDLLSIPINPEPPYLHGLMHLVRDKTGTTLEDVGRWVSSHSNWPIRDAAWFVLTGEPPETVSLEVSSDALSGMRKLVFAPWISERTIRRAYRSLQGSDNQPLRQKSLSAFRFVEKHTEPGQIPRWEELRQQWNERYPEDRFTDRSALRRAYKRAEERLATPWLHGQVDAAE